MYGICKKCKKAHFIKNAFSCKLSKKFKNMEIKWHKNHHLTLRTSWNIVSHRKHVERLTFERLQQSWTFHFQILYNSSLNIGSIFYLMHFGVLTSNLDNTKIMKPRARRQWTIPKGASPNWSTIHNNFIDFTIAPRLFKHYKCSFILLA